MFIENRTAKVAIISLLVLLLIPLLVMLGMMAFGIGIMAQMGARWAAGKWRFPFSGVF
jgi:hypothetical protein